MAVEEAAAKTPMTLAEMVEAMVQMVSAAGETAAADRVRRRAPLANQEGHYTQAEAAVWAFPVEQAVQAAEVTVGGQTHRGAVAVRIPVAAEAVEQRQGTEAPVL